MRQIIAVAVDLMYGILASGVWRLACTLIVCELGLGVSNPELMEIVNAFNHEESVIQEMQLATQKVISGMLNRKNEESPNLAKKLIEANSLDHGRAKSRGSMPPKRHEMGGRVVV
jgi:hypothetical protein